MCLGEDGDGHCPLGFTPGKSLCYKLLQNPAAKDAAATACDADVSAWFALMISAVLIRLH